MFLPIAIWASKTHSDENHVLKMYLSNDGGPI